MTSPIASTATGGPPPDPTRRSSHLESLRCRRCGQVQALGPAFVCPACFGPLEVVYDLAVARAQLDAVTLAGRPSGIWRYLELLPVAAPPARGLAVGGTALVRADGLAHALGLRTLWLKDDSRNPTLSFKDRVVAMAAARAVEFGFDTLACASTGNLAGATAAAAAVAGLRCVVFVPADLEPPKIAQALAYGATVVPVNGTYDQVNRLSLEVAGEYEWAFVNVNLRPYYAEGSKTLAFEVAEQLGWRLPDVLVAPLASGSLYVKTGKAVRELEAVGLVEPHPVRFVGGQAAGCAPIAAAFHTGRDVIEPVRDPDTFVKSLAIGDPADGAYALELARTSGGSLEAVPDQATAAAIRLVAETEGIYTETAGGVTVAALQQALARGVVRPEDEVVVLLTGNGLKTPDARTVGLEAPPGGRDGARIRPGQAGLAEPIGPSLRSFEAWYASA
ncbi:MAG: threonine synthase [Candidatus Limnocylindrales bacterium]